MTEREEAAVRVERKRAARQLIEGWLRFTPVEYLPVQNVDGDHGSDGSVVLEIRVRVQGRDIERQLERQRAKVERI